MRAMQKVIQIIAAYDICAKKHCTMPLYCTIMFAIFLKLFFYFVFVFMCPTITYICFALCTLKNVLLKVIRFLEEKPPYRTPFFLCVKS